MLEKLGFQSLVEQTVISKRIPRGLATAPLRFLFLLEKMDEVRNRRVTRCHPPSPGKRMSHPSPVPQRTHLRLHKKKPGVPSLAARAGVEAPGRRALPTSRLNARFRLADTKTTRCPSFDIEQCSMR